MLRLLKDQRGFTLTELLTVIIVIGVLSMLAIPKFMSIISKAKVTECKPILKQISVLEQAYFDEHGSYTSEPIKINFDLPVSQFFDYSIKADSTTFEARATCKGNIKDANGDFMNGEWVSINHKEERGGTEKLRALLGW